MKTCFKCGKEKPIGEFYKNKGMADGRLNKCKTCTKYDVNKNRNENIDYYREYDRSRANEPHRIEARKEYAKTPNGKKAINRASKAWRDRNIIKRAAHILVGNAVRDGKLTKPDNCSRCGSDGMIHGHHDDYTKPLDVMWLCPPCHQQRHNEIDV